METSRVDGVKGRRDTNLLHLDLVVHVGMPPLNFVDLGLFDQFEGELRAVALPRYFVDGGVVARAELAQEFKMLRSWSTPSFVPLLLDEISQLLERFSFLLSSVIFVSWKVLKGFVETSISSIILLVLTESPRFPVVGLGVGLV